MRMEINDRLISRIIGISTAAAILVSVSIVHNIASLRTGTVQRANIAVSESAENTESVGGTIVIPFHENTHSRPSKEFSVQDAARLRRVYDELVSSENERQHQHDTDAASTAPTSQETVQVITSTTPGSTVETSAPTADQETGFVSNGQREFNYSDVTSVAEHLCTLGEFVEQLHPTSFCWDASEYDKHGCVKISLISPSGNVVLEVKPLHELSGKGSYLIDGEVSGSIGTASIDRFEWYRQNRDGGCNICSVTWMSDDFAIAPVRGIGLGTSMADVVGQYLCVNGGATTLYKASDVIKDQKKLNDLLASESVYTFVGGRVYTIDSYLDKYDFGSKRSYPFADCDTVVQYGCNSIMDCNYTSGSWIIEYAVKEDAVVGITFMNKSYYKTEPQVTSATAAPTSATETTAGTTTTAASDVESEGTAASVSETTAPTAAETQVMAESTAFGSSQDSSDGAETREGVSKGDTDTVSTTATVE